MTKREFLDKLKKALANTTISGKIFGRIFFSFSRLKILFDSNQIEMLLIIFLTSYFKESGLIIVALSAKDRYQCANLLIENVRK